MGSHHPRYNVVSWRWLHCCKSSKFNAEHDTSNLTWYFAIEVSNSTIQLHTHVFYLHFSFSFIFIFRFGFFLTLLYNYYCVLEKRGTFILPRILPESPRWILLHSASSRSTSEAQGLLERAVTEDQRQTSKYRDFGKSSTCRLNQAERAVSLFFVLRNLGKQPLFWGLLGELGSVSFVQIRLQFTVDFTKHSLGGWECSEKHSM